ncbi:response regulator [Escherichia coli]
MTTCAACAAGTLSHRQGFQVRSVANAEQIDRLLTRESFHLMVLDLMLPGEDGLSICRRLRSQSNPMPIIMVTAKGEKWTESRPGDWR